MTGVVFEGDVRFSDVVVGGCHEMVQHFCQNAGISRRTTVAIDILRTNLLPERRLTGQGT